MRLFVDRTLIQNKLNLGPKKQCCYCHSKKSDKFMDIRKGLCKECATKVDMLKEKQKRREKNAERRYAWLAAKKKRRRREGIA